MINLLPIEESLALKRLYRGRLLIAALTLVFLLIIFSLVTLLPTYLIFSANLEGLEAQLEEISQRVSGQGIQDLIEIVNSVDQKIKILSSDGNFAFGEVLEKLVEHGNRLVSIKSLSIGASGEVAIAGTAASRQRFLDFIRSLEREPFFSRVDSPISNLIAVRDINFRVILAVATSSRRSF